MKVTKNKIKDSILSIRISQEDKDAILAKAKELGVKHGEMVVEILLQHLEGLEVK